MWYNFFETKEKKLKYVLLTGAYGGMGRAVLSALKKAGYFVFAADKTVGEAEENVLPIQTDITNSDSVRAAFGAVAEKTDRLYAIIHLAGIYCLDSLAEIDEEKFLRAFDVNVFGAYRINKYFLQLLKNGRIVIVTSELAPLEPLPFTGIYAVTKSTLDKYAYSLRMELQLLDIKVSVLRPGAVETKLLSDSTAELDKFCESTQLYSCNAERFKRIVDSVEARSVKPERVAAKMLKIISAKRPKYVYKLNRNPLLLLLNMLPKRVQTRIIKRILK